MASILTEKLQQAFKHIRGYGKLTESNISEGMKQIRLALLAADVNYQVARDFCEKVKERSLGKEVAASIVPGDLFVKIVHDELLNLFQNQQVDLPKQRPLNLLLCGLNGSGKTTTAGKLALHLKRSKEKILLVPADLTRPAAVQQLQTLGKQIDTEVYTPQTTSLLQHIRNALDYSQENGFTVTIYDTAGRLEVDEALLKELSEISQIINPQEVMLVLDSASGQVSLQVTTAFQQTVPLTGLILSKFDSDAKGGAALSFRHITSAPIRFIGTGEQLNQFELFDPQRLVNKILGMGDLLGLVEKVQTEIDLQDTEHLAQKFQSNTFTLQDFLGQMKMLKKLGPLQNLLGMIPGMNNIPNSADAEKALKKTEALICSMTYEERKRPSILNASRRKRIASGSGTTVADVNQLIRQFNGMKKMMAKFTRGGNQEQKLKKLLSHIN